MQTSTMKGKIYVMGAATGDPHLLTDQAVRVLRAAEVVLHDDLVSGEILDLIPASAQVRNVDKLSAPAGRLQETVHSLVVSAARQGHQVLRLKATGPVSSARADEEIEALRQAGIDYELVPASASAVGAVAGASSR